MSTLDVAIDPNVRYGAIELKSVYKKYFSRGLVISAIIHIIVLGGLLLFQYLRSGDEKKIPLVRIRNLSELAPPPSTSQSSAPPPVAVTAQVAQLNIGVPVPVPDAQAPTQVLASIEEVSKSGPVGDVNATGSGPIVVAEEEPDPDQFVPVEVEPQIVTNLSNVIVYPEVAKRAGIEGKVIARVLVGKDGKPKKTLIVSSDAEVFNKAAEDAIMKCLFKPAIQNGQPIEVWVTYPISFKLTSR